MFIKWVKYWTNSMDWTWWSVFYFFFIRSLPISMRFFLLLSLHFISFLSLRFMMLWLLRHFQSCLKFLTGGLETINYAKFTISFGHKQSRIYVSACVCVCTRVWTIKFPFRNNELRKHPKKSINLGKCISEYVCVCVCANETNISNKRKLFLSGIMYFCCSVSVSVGLLLMRKMNY